MAKCAIHFQGEGKKGEACVLSSLFYNTFLVQLTASIKASSFLLCETWQFITAAVKTGNKEWQKVFYSRGNGVSEDLFAKVMAIPATTILTYYFYNFTRKKIGRYI